MNALLTRLLYICTFVACFKLVFLFILTATFKNR